MSQPQVKRSVGIVYSKDGWPRIEADWVKHLTPVERQWIDDQLAERGFRIGTNFEVIEVT